MSIVFKKKFDQKALEAIDIRLLDFKPSGNKGGEYVAKLRYQKLTEFGNWRTYEVIVSKEVYSSFRTRYQRTVFPRGKDAVMAIYDGNVVDIELTFSSEEIDMISGLDVKDRKALEISILRVNVGRLKKEPLFSEGWFFDGRYFFKPDLLKDVKNIGTLGVNLYSCFSINLSNLKSSTIVAQMDLLKGSRKVLGLLSEEDGVESLKLSTTFSDSGSWVLLANSPERADGSYLNIEFAIKMHSTLGHYYGVDSANFVDMFHICMDSRAFPSQIDDASKLLAEFINYDEKGTRVSRSQNIKNALEILVNKSSSETCDKKLRGVAKLISHLSSKGISHTSRCASLYKKGGEEFLSQGLIDLKNLDFLNAPEKINIDELSLDDFFKNEAIESSDALPATDAVA